MLDPSGNGRPVANVYRTYAQHPTLNTFGVVAEPNSEPLPARRE